MANLNQARLARLFRLSNVARGLESQFKKPLYFIYGAREKAANLTAF
ncbi:hypothetical protein CAMRE0001_1539 [Campylobacter rectus RM3267]|uniref:Uncharacterized protein n=1 Tax=Campylobacter rectus RM3267 TaxID=553218 RepID=B9CZI0_CAMRE|nr:hypothetical protein CAMRE0001_1539 [Campylobacter rectus RM3267]